MINTKNTNQNSNTNYAKKLAERIVGLMTGDVVAGASETIFSEIRGILDSAREKNKIVCHIGGILGKASLSNVLYHFRNYFLDKEFAVIEMMFHTSFLGKVVEAGNIEKTTGENRWNHIMPGRRKTTWYHGVAI